MTNTGKKKARNPLPPDPTYIFHRQPDNTVSPGLPFVLLQKDSYYSADKYSLV